jgi:cell division protein FtsI (penicillin-binding protein 3)
VIHDDHPKGAITLTEVIKYSSNIGAAKLAFALGADLTLRYLADFGFGRSPGLGLPGETAGFLRPAAGIKPIELATVAYGHGVSVSNVQLAAAMAALANGGIRMEPQLVREVRDHAGHVVARFEPHVDRRVVSAATATRIVEMMTTVTETGGTGTRARVRGHRVAGKTGTAWKHEDGHYSSTDRIGSFVGIVPADAPRLAIAVAIDTPHEGSRYGGIVAAPVFADVAAGALRVLGVPPTVEEPAEVAVAPLDEAAPIPIVGPELVVVDEASYLAPDLSGLSYRDALGALQGAGLPLATRGTGRVVDQTPQPGSVLRVGNTVEVVLR